MATLIIALVLFWGLYSVSGGRLANQPVEHYRFVSLADSLLAMSVLSRLNSLWLKKA